MKYKATPNNSDMKPLTREEVRKFSGAYGKRALLSVPKVLALLDERDELLADHNAALAEVERLRGEVERLKGLKPELPPFPPAGAGLPRYGLRWPPAANQAPLAVPMDDGYWTPAHLAEAEVERLRDLLEARTEVCIDLLATAARLREALHHVRMCRECSEADWTECEQGRAALAALAALEALGE